MRSDSAAGEVAKEPNYIVMQILLIVRRIEIDWGRERGGKVFWVGECGAAQNGWVRKNAGSGIGGGMAV